MLFGNGLLGNSLSATYVGAGLAHHQTCPTHTQNICQRILCHIPTLFRVFIFRATKENISLNKESFI